MPGNEREKKGKKVKLLPQKNISIVTLYLRSILILQKKKKNAFKDLNNCV